jgi:hypothetical protein
MAGRCRRRRRSRCCATTAPPAAATTAACCCSVSPKCRNAAPAPTHRVKPEPGGAAGRGCGDHRIASPRSKTDSNRQGAEIGLPRGKHEETCPLRAFKELIAHRSEPPCSGWTKPPSSKQNCLTSLVGFPSVRIYPWTLPPSPCGSPPSLSTPLTGWMMQEASSLLDPR